MSKRNTKRSPFPWKNAFKLAIPLLFVITCTVSCEDDHEHEEGEGMATEATCPATQTLTYANFGQAFMQSYCLRCHSQDVMGNARQGAPSDHNFDTLDEIQGLAEHIDEYAGSGPAATNTGMPTDTPSPSTEERRKLSEWLACGAPP
jgi:uncharacterized membrane protein